jgi:hypothetical protein
MIKSVLENGALGNRAFTCFLVLMSYSGITSAMRDEEGNFKKKK